MCINAGSIDRTDGQTQGTTHLLQLVRLVTDEGDQRRDDEGEPRVTVEQGWELVDQALAPACGRLVII